MQTAREKAISIIKDLPDDSPMMEIIEKLSFIEMVEQGIKDLDNSKIVYEDEAGKILEKWLK